MTSSTTLSNDSLAVGASKAVSQECQAWWAKLDNPDKCAQVIQGLTGEEEEQFDDALATSDWWTNKEGGGKLMAFCVPIVYLLIIVGVCIYHHCYKKKRDGRKSQKGQSCMANCSKWWELIFFQLLINYSLD